MLSAYGGMVLFALLGKIFIPDNEGGKFLLAIVGAIIGAKVGKKLNKMVKCLATAFIGSFFLCKGIAFYAGGAPENLEDLDAQREKEFQVLLMYIGGFLVNTIVGTVVQIKYFKEEDGEGDDFMK